MKSILTFFLFLACVQAHTQISIQQTWVENRPDPNGITTQAPRLSWAMESDKRGAAQRAYQVRVATSEAGLSGEVEFD